MKEHCDDSGDERNTNDSGRTPGNVYPIEIYSSAVVDGFCSSLAEGSDIDDGNIIHGGINSSSGSGSGGISGNISGGMLYHRNAWAVFESEAAKVCAHNDKNFSSTPIL